MFFCNLSILELWEFFKTVSTDSVKKGSETFLLILQVFLRTALIKIYL